MKSPTLFGLLIAFFSVFFIAVAPAALAVGTPSFTVRNVSEPTVVSPNDELNCEEASGLWCDSYQVLATNVGDEFPSRTLTLIDKLPAGSNLPRSSAVATAVQDCKKDESCTREEDRA